VNGGPSSSRPPGVEARTKPVVASRRLWTPAKQSRACS